MNMQSISLRTEKNEYLFSCVSLADFMEGVKLKFPPVLVFNCPPFFAFQFCQTPSLGIHFPYLTEFPYKTLKYTSSLYITAVEVLYLVSSAVCHVLFYIQEEQENQVFGFNFFSQAGIQLIDLAMPELVLLLMKTAVS